jgi:hypothetical protein
MKLVVENSVRLDVIPSEDSQLSDRSLYRTERCICIAGDTVSNMFVLFMNVRKT